MTSSTEWIINLHSSHLWSLNTEAPHTQYNSKWHSLLFSLLPQWCKTSKRRAPPSRQRVTEASEQTTVLSRHHDKAPKTELWGGAKFSSETHHTLQGLLVNPVTLSMPKFRFNTMSSLAPMQSYFQPASALQCISILFVKKYKLNFWAIHQPYPLIKDCTQQGTFCWDAHSSTRPRDTEVEVEMVAW